MARKLLNGCLILLVAFICPLAVIVSAGGGSLVFASPIEPSEVEVDVRHPKGVPLNEPFLIHISVTNEADGIQTLNDIDLNAGALDVLEMVDASPPFLRTSRAPFFQVYWFEEEIRAGETLEVSLEMVARETGTHPLRLGVCINVPESCMDFESTLVVTK